MSNLKCQKQILNLKTDKVKSIEIIDSCAYFYFVHSYYCVPGDKRAVRAMSDYGGEFAAVVNQNNFWGTQFHPEKSGEQGLRLLRNFCNL
jgi:glutamine amidotransferase